MCEIWIYGFQKVTLTSLFDIIFVYHSRMITNDLIIVTLHYFGWQVMPEYHWNHWIDPIVFPYILPITQIALTGGVVNDIDISGKWNIENTEFSRIEINIPWYRPKDVQKNLLPGHNLEIIIFLSQEVFTVWLLLLSSGTSTSASLSTEIWLVPSAGPSAPLRTT